MSNTAVSTRPSLDGPAVHSTRRLYFLRTGFAWTWAALLALALATTDALTSGATPAAAVLTLLIVYPVVDVIASVRDALTHQRHGFTTDANVQWVNAGLSTVTAAAIAIAHTASGVLHVFGIWAVVSGLIQLALAIARRRQGRPAQWPMILSGGISTVAGLGFNAMATHEDISLGNLAGYAVMGGLFYLISAFRQSSRA